jgi:hypothetical protein
VPGGTVVLEAEAVLLVVAEPVPPPVAWPMPGWIETSKTSPPMSMLNVRRVSFIRKSRQQWSYQKRNLCEKVVI